MNAPGSINKEFWEKSLLRNNIALMPNKKIGIPWSHREHTFGQDPSNLLLSSSVLKQDYMWLEPQLEHGWNISQMRGRKHRSQNLPSRHKNNCARAYTCGVFARSRFCLIYINARSMARQHRYLLGIPSYHLKCHLLFHISAKYMDLVCCFLFYVSLLIMVMNVCWMVVAQAVL